MSTDRRSFLANLAYVLPLGLGASALRTDAEGVPVETGGEGMHDMTSANLRSAHGGESMASTRYSAWARKADEDGFPNVARLFRAVAHAELVHAMNHFVCLADMEGGTPVTAMAGFGIAETSTNLAGAIEGETFEVEEMYPAFMEVAEAQGEDAAGVSMFYAIEAEKQHAELYSSAKRAVDAGNDIGNETVHVCNVCGHTVIGDAPDMCPVCASGSEMFAAFSA